jgi:hypothetical protein
MNRAPSRTEFAAATLAAIVPTSYTDAPAREYAIANLANRAPAFWHTASATHAQIAELSSEANRFASLERALDSIEDHYSRTGQHNRRIRTAEIFDALIPLNAAAMSELDAAYREIATFRSRDELAARSGLELAVA